jgi:hypothetical protein
VLPEPLPLPVLENLFTPPMSAHTSHAVTAVDAVDAVVYPVVQPKQSATALPAAALYLPASHAKQLTPESLE